MTQVFVATEAVHYDTAEVLGVATTEEGAKKIVDRTIAKFARPDLVKDWSTQGAFWIRRGRDSTFYIEPHELEN